MPIYTKDKLEQDILDKVVEYTVNSVSDIKTKEIEHINKIEYGYDYHINKLNLDFKQFIRTLKNYYPKTYDYLIYNNLYYQLIMYWYQLTKNSNPHHNKPITHSAINGIIQNDVGQVKTDHFARALHWVQQVGWDMNFEFLGKDR
ncbi:hypothetical protein [Moraxella sp.]|uniref:hypothetical protein n=1 Tax=Moraxella sp. TaxID=479 RepID=UPI0026DD35F1|nr:hypothetical protein [Moraxella sp.]MDO4894371.1 hypothetical protein [Moraxella sp.]